MIKEKSQNAFVLTHSPDMSSSKVRGQFNYHVLTLPEPAGLHMFCILSASIEFPSCPATDVLSNVTDCCNLDSRQPLSKLPESL